MAKTTIEIDLKVKGSESVGQVEEKAKSLKAQLKEMKALLASGTLDSDQFRKLSIEAGKLQDQIADVNQRVKNLASDSRRLDAVVNAAQGIVGGFTAVQGVMALVGNENEDLQRTLLKVQGAMAALNGLQAVANTLNKDSALMTEIASKGWNKLNDSIKAGAIGLVITAIAVVISKLEDWTSATEDQISAQDDLNAKLKQTDDALNSSIGSHDYYTKLYLDNLKKQGKGQTEINDLLERQRKADTDALYKDSQAKTRIQEQAYQRLSDAQFNYQYDSSESNKKFVEDAKKALDDANAAQEKAIKAYNDRLDKNDIERSRDRLALEEETKKKQEEAEKKRKEKADKRKAFDDEVKKKIQEQNERDAVLEIQLEEYKTERFAKVRAVDTEKINKEANDRLFALGAYNKAVAQAEWSLVEAKSNALNAGFNIAQQFAGKNKALADTLFVIQKGVAIAQVIVDTQKEIAGYWSNPTWKALPDGGVTLATSATAAAKVRAATSIATIAATTVGKFMNGGGGASVGGGSSTSGGGVGSTASAPGINRFTPTTTSGGQSSQRVYVLEKDITDSQGRVAKIRHNATLI